MIVKNPTDQRISVVVKGHAYSIEPNSFITGVREEDATDWKTNTHQSIILEQEVKVTPKEPVEVKEVIDEPQGKAGVETSEIVTKKKK